MIITIDEFRELGFECAEADEERLAGCIKRAEYALNALTRGTLGSAMTQSESSANLIKQAAAFEADALLKAELSGGAERVSLGDFSYSESSGGEAVNVPETVRKLLCAAGCLFGGLEVTE